MTASNSRCSRIEQITAQMSVLSLALALLLGFLIEMSKAIKCKQIILG